MLGTVPAPAHAVTPTFPFSQLQPAYMGWKTAYLTKNILAVGLAQQLHVFPSPLVPSVPSPCGPASPHSLPPSPSGHTPAHRISFLHGNMFPATSSLTLVRAVGR